MAARRLPIAFAAIAAAALAGGAATAATPTATFVDPAGTHAPPADLNGQPMTRFARDHRKLGRAVTTVGGVRFSRGVGHYLVRNRAKGPFWKTWSNGYRGDVYGTPGKLTITLPPGTTAFYFYAEPNDPGTYTITAASGGASSGRVRVYNWHGARFFGFVAQPGRHLYRIVVSSSDRYVKHHQGGFAIGEFGIHAG